MRHEQSNATRVMLRCVAVCCSVLQCVAVTYFLKQRLAMSFQAFRGTCDCFSRDINSNVARILLRDTAARCSTVQQ